MSRAQILVTGGTGYIGSHTVVKLIESGFEPILLDNLHNSSKSVLGGIRKITGTEIIFHEVDVCDRDGLDAILDQYTELNCVIHFAALKAVNESIQKPLEYYQNNVGGFLELVHQCRKRDIKHVIFSSSATIYGVPDELPITENSPSKPATNPYGNTKRICEEILEDVVKADNSINGISLRYFNPIGAHRSGEIGEAPQGIPNNLMPIVTQTAAGIRKELLVFGGDYETHDGTAIRDYIHVEDLAEAHVVAAKRLLNKTNHKPYEVFNLGTGKGYSVLEVIQTFERATSIHVPYRIVERRKGDVPIVYADTTKANNELGWVAKRDLVEMTSSAWNWECKFRSRTER